jgi:hypothetical protein
VLPLLTPLYNFENPRLWGLPAFYWLQLSFVFVGVATTSIVYQMTRKPPSSPASSSAASALSSSSSEASDE